ncbi:MAG: lipocalin-like domain-containing protein [Acidimicrobiia bacterium]|nr:lipocalin-like domain-containing protein [Acidimicrobiia bacterium]
MQSLIGTWRLVEWTLTLDGVPAAKPFGGNPTGLLTYADDGRMSATLMRTDRPSLGSTTLAAAKEAQRAAAAAGYVAYAGTYEIVGDEVHHRVEVSLFPDWVGGVQQRRMAWQDGDLVLSSVGTVTRDGKTAVNRLRWRRIAGGNE